MKKSVIFFLFLFPSILFAELPELDPYTEFEPIPLGHFNRFIESIVAHEVFSLSDLPDRPIVEGQAWKDWGSNMFNMAGDVHTVRLRFVDTRTVPNRKDEARAPSFDLDIHFEDSLFIEERMALFTQKTSTHRGDDSYRLVLKHSRAARPEEVNGIRIGVREDKENRIFFNGLDETGVTIFAPKVARTGFGGRAVLVCPRNFDVWRAKRGLTKMEINDYELNSVSFEVQGQAKGKVGSGMGPGYAKATLQTSSNIAATKFPIDVSTSNYPFASVTYRPAQQVVATGVAGQESITAGLRLGLVHHNSFSHKTESVATVTLGVRKIEVKAPLELMYNKKPFVIESGTCIAILKEMKLVQSHSKEALPSRSVEKQSQAEESAEELPGENLFDENDGLDTGRGESVSPLELLLSQ